MLWQTPRVSRCFSWNDAKTQKFVQDDEAHFDQGLWLHSSHNRKIWKISHYNLYITYSSGNFNSSNKNGNYKKQSFANLLVIFNVNILLCHEECLNDWVAVAGVAQVHQADHPRFGSMMKNWFRNVRWRKPRTFNRTDNVHLRKPAKRFQFWNVSNGVLMTFNCCHNLIIQKSKSNRRESAWISMEIWSTKTWNKKTGLNCLSISTTNSKFD